MRVRGTELSFERWMNRRLTMRPAMHYLSIRACQADALFASALQRSDEPDVNQVRRAIAASIRAFGSPGCAQRVAQEFGDHPDTAVVRMRSRIQRQSPAWNRMLARCRSPRLPAEEARSNDLDGVGRRPEP